jgi:hypothetical protein
MEELMRVLGRPEFNRHNKGSDFINQELRKRLYDQGAQPVCIERGGGGKMGTSRNFTV